MSRLRTGIPSSAASSTSATATSGTATATSIPNIDFSLFGGAEELPASLRKKTPTNSSSSSSSISASSSEDGGSDREQGWEGGVEASGVVVPEGLKLPQRYDVDPNDFLWLHTEEPHRSRRRAILKAHPEITKLMGYEPLTKYVVIGVMAIQFLLAYLLRNTNPLSPIFVLTAYVIGGTANQNLFLAIHEITHNLAFKGIKANRLFAMFANLPIGVPYAMLFKKYHLEHHKALGEDGIDTDLPSRFELLCLNNVAGKTFFCTFQILFYALRPGFIKSQPFTRWVALNFLLSFGLDFVLVRYLGWNALWYLIMSSFWAGSLHPCAAHFIAEHYLMEGTDQETTSYYGPLNVLAYNVGYHNEHHDFPSIPWTRLPKLRAIASEYYDLLPAHSSWPMVTVKFIFDPSVGLFSRVKRESKKVRDEGYHDAKVQGGTGSFGGLKDD